MPPADRTAPAELRPPVPTPGGGSSDGVDRATGLDPELVALQAPPQGQRIAALTVMAAAVVAAMAMVITLRADVRYSLSSPQAVDLGEVQSLSPGELTSNSYVRIKGLPTLAQAVRFSQGMGVHYRVFPLAGQRNVYVQIADEGGESFVRSEFSGRLVTFDDLGGRYSELARAMQQDVHLPVTGESFLLLADEPPSSYAWTWIVFALCVAFVMLDVYFILRWFKPVRWMEVANEND